MTVTSPARPRAATVLRFAALAAGVLLVFAVGRAIPARAIAEGDVQIQVTQAPAGGSVLLAGTAVTFTAETTVTNAPAVTPLYLEFDYPAGLSYQSGASTPPGVVCTNNLPTAGVVRCDYGVVVAGPLVPVTLTFFLAADSAIDGSQFMIRAGNADGAPDTAAAGGDDTTTDVGPLTVAYVGSGSGPALLFEGGQGSYTTTIQNNSGGPSGAFTASTTFSNATVLGGSCSAGTFSGSGSATATCTGADIADAAALTLQANILAANTAGGADITPTISAPSLGINGAQATIPVNEVGLENTGAALGTGTAVNVCTNTIAADATDDAAAGAAQPASGLMVGTTSLNQLLQTNDFSVTGPGVGAVAAATGCGTNQSGVRFTPSAAGTYVVTANYNTGGTNVLSLEVPGPGAPVATKLTYTTQPSGNVNAGVALPAQPVIAVQTAGSATVTTDNTTQVSLAISGSGVLTCTGGLTRTVSSGVATFSGCSVTPAGTYTITASSSPVLTPAVSSSFTINAPATKLAFTTQPGNGVANQNLATQPVVTVQTAASATVSTDNTTQVTLAISDGATLTCDGGLTRTVAAGVAAFTGCKVAPAGTGYTLTATSSPTLTSAISAEFDVTAAPPTTSNQLVVQTPASGAVPRSRLTFRVATGTLAPTEVRFIVRRTSDNQYWNATTGAWQAGNIQNLAANAGSGNFTLAVTGDDRRDFVNTSVTVEVRATVGSTTYVNATIPTIPVR